MVKPDIANLDASVREAAELQFAIISDGKKPQKRMSVDEALSHPRMVGEQTDRASLRVLFVSQDERLLNPEFQSLDGFLNLADMFEEVHILILREGIKSMTPALRVSTNVWLYTAASKYWFRVAAAGKDMAREQLVFASGFRPDLIVARDPFESAIVASSLGDMFDCPTQLHILEDFTTEEFIKKQRHGRWRRFLPARTTKKFNSVRVATDTLHRLIEKKYRVADLEVLPRFQDYRALTAGKEKINLKEIYKPFVFVMVFAGTLGHDSTLFRAIDAARFALRNPRVGLLVLGDGPARTEFEKRTKLLGIQEQVVFERRVSDVIPYIAAADMLIATDTTPEADELVFTAAAAGTPVVMAETPLRSDVFENGVSGFLCDPQDTQAFTDRISDILNNITLRNVLKEGAKDAVLRKFHQHPSTYRRQYQASIEQAIFVDADQGKAESKP
jgi:glycosyltransferase involved in cell wall biosynthesis